MTVKELINELQKFDKNIEVVLDSVYHNYDEHDEDINRIYIDEYGKLNLEGIVL